MTGHTEVTQFAEPAFRKSEGAMPVFDVTCRTADYTATWAVAVNECFGDLASIQKHP